MSSSGRDPFFTASSTSFHTSACPFLDVASIPQSAHCFTMRTAWLRSTMRHDRVFVHAAVAPWWSGRRQVIWIALPAFACVSLNMGFFLLPQISPAPTRRFFFFPEPALALDDELLEELDDEAIAPLIF